MKAYPDTQTPEDTGFEPLGSDTLDAPEDSDADCGGRDATSSAGTETIITLDAPDHYWFMIQNLIFTAPHYLWSLMINTLEGHDPDRDVIWFNKSSSNLYATRWRPDICLVKLTPGDAMSLDDTMKAGSIGRLVKDTRGEFVTMSDEEAHEFEASPYDETLIGKPVLMRHGPFDTFYGTIAKYDTDTRSYLIDIPLLKIHHTYTAHYSEFEVLDTLP